MPLSTSIFPRTTAALLLAGASGASQATLITFDERPRACFLLDCRAWYHDPIGDYYDGLGVNFGGGYSAYLQPADSAYPGDGMDGQYVYMTGDIEFTGTLPTFVGLDFTSPNPEYRATVLALDINRQVIASVDTGGRYIDQNGWQYTPYTSENYASFHSESGIWRLDFLLQPGSHSIGGKIDNLYFGDVAAVPEPAAIALWAAGLGVIGVRVARRRRTGLNAGPAAA